MIFVILLVTVFPVLSGVQRDSKKLALIKQNIIYAKAESEQMAEFKDKYESIKPNLEKIDSLLVDLQTPLEFIQFIEGLALKTGVVPQISMPAGGSQRAPGEVLSSVQIQMPCRGKKADILKFIEYLEFGKYLITVMGVDLRESEAGLYQANLNIKLFVQ